MSLFVSELDASSRERSPSTAPEPAGAQPAPRELNLLSLSLIVLGLGIFTGAGAALFRALIRLIHNFAFPGQLSAHYDANHFTGSAPWGR